jgi:uncharacterized membrane protein YesL
LAGLRVAWFSLRALYADMFLLVGASVVWFLLELPLAAVAGGVGWALAHLIGEGFGVEVPESLFGFGFVALSLLGPSPAAAGLGTLAARIAQEELFGFELFWQGVRRQWRRSLGLWLIALAGLVLLAANAHFYWSREHLALRALGALFGWAALLWYALQLFVTPILVEQARPGVRSALRNAAVVTVAHPLFALSLLVVSLVGIALAAVVALLAPLVLGAFLGLIQARAVAELKWRYYPDEMPRPADELEGT